MVNIQLLVCLFLISPPKVYRWILSWPISSTLQFLWTNKIQLKLKSLNNLIYWMVLTRAVYWASLFNTIQYNTFICDIRYIGWTICLNIFGEKDQKRPRTVMAHLYSIDFVICVGHLADLVTNLLWHWWWTVIFVFNQMLQLVRIQITFGSIVLFLRWIFSKFVCFLLEDIFEFWTSSPTIKSAIFKPDLILAYCQNNVSYIAWQTYTSTYRYIDSPLVLTHQSWWFWMLWVKVPWVHS